eukprot:GSA120T00001636001.1
MNRDTETSTSRPPGGRDGARKNMPTTSIMEPDLQNPCESHLFYGIKESEEENEQDVEDDPLLHGGEGLGGEILRGAAVQRKNLDRPEPHLNATRDLQLRDDEENDDRNLCDLAEDENETDAEDEDVNEEFEAGEEAANFAGEDGCNENGSEVEEATEHEDEEEDDEFEIPPEHLNICRANRPHGRLLIDMFHTLLDQPTPRLLSLVSIIYIAHYLLFAFVYVLLDFLPRTELLLLLSDAWFHVSDTSSPHDTPKVNSAAGVTTTSVISNSATASSTTGLTTGGIAAAALAPAARDESTTSAASGYCNLGFQPGWKAWVDAMYLSIETSATMGFGAKDPYFGHCMGMWVVLSLQMLISILLDS